MIFIAGGGALNAINVIRAATGTGGAIEDGEPRPPPDPPATKRDEIEFWVVLGGALAIFILAALIGILPFP